MAFDVEKIRLDFPILVAVYILFVIYRKYHISRMIIRPRMKMMIDAYHEPGSFLGIQFSDGDMQAVYEFNILIDKIGI